MEKLTHQEEEAMRFIWEIGPCIIKEVLARYDDPRPPYTTVASVINKLKSKGYLKAKKIGNTYQYTPTIAKEEYTQKSVGNLVKNYFANSYKDMVSYFAKEQKISKEDLETIISLIEEDEKR